MTKESPETTETNEWIIDWTKKSLSLLEKETWINFFKKASDWIKRLFWFKSDDEQSSNTWWQSEQKIDKSGQRAEQTTEPSQPQIDQSESNEGSSKLKVSETWNYITNGGTFYSWTKKTCKWNGYNWVCSTGSFNVLRRLWLPKVSKNTEVDLTGERLTKMWLKYIWEVNPKNPSSNWYKPQDWDTAVWPKFTRSTWRKAWQTTQHQATYINWHRVSDNIQNRMSCYGKEPNEPNCKVYRYMA